MTRGTPRLSTTFTAFADVQQMSLSAFTSARGVDVGDDRHAGIGLAQHAHVLGRDGGGQRAAGPEVGDEHRLVGIEQLRGLGHEVHARLHDDLGIGARRFLGELQAVATDVADAVEDLRRHVVVRQDDGVALLLQVVDGLDERRELRPLERRDDLRHPGVEGLHLASQLRREFGQVRHRQDVAALAAAAVRAVSD